MPPHTKAAAEQQRRHRRRQIRYTIYLLVAALVIVTSAGVITAVILANNDRDNEATNHRIEREARRLSWLGCRRNQLEAAELHASAVTVGGPSLLAERREREPLVDCAPLLAGLAPVRLAVWEQARWERFFGRTNRPAVVWHGHVLYRADAAPPYNTRPPP